MTCDELQTRLRDYAHGNMSVEEEAAFETHLDGCHDCSSIVALAEPELRQAAALPKAVAPVQDLWPGIQARIESRRLKGRVLLPRWALAAAAALLVTASSLVTLTLVRSGHPPAGQASGRLVGFEAEYSAASEDLTAALAAARGRLAPETILTIERNLALIDNALAESRGALAADPGNSALEQLVVAAWQQKVDLLRRATSLPGTS